MYKKSRNKGPPDAPKWRVSAARSCQDRGFPGRFTVSYALRRSSTNTNFSTTTTTHQHFYLKPTQLIQVIMASISNEQFLLACIESLNGKASPRPRPAALPIANRKQINFKEVANKLGMKENAW